MRLLIMMLIPILSVLFVISFNSQAQPAPGQAAQPSPPFAPDKVLVAFRPGTPGAEMARAHAAAGANVLQTFESIGLQLVEVPVGTVEEKINLYQRNPNIRYAEPNYYRPLILPNEGNDPPPPLGLGIDYLSQQWGLNNTAQSLYNPDTGTYVQGTTDADMDAPEGWDLSTGTPSVKVAVLDTGVECTHVDLQGKCLEQLNFTISSNALDQLGHGTHVAGIIAANTHNDTGVAGVGWDTVIGSLKVCREYPNESFPLVGMCDVADSIEGILYAADNGYQVINMSYGSDPDPYTPSQAEADAIRYAWSQGVVLVAAAGNDYADSHSYPAAFPEVIAVAASDRHDNLAAFSTFGASWVSVLAPGHQIFSTYPNAGCGLPLDDPDGCYTWLSGTSMAAPHVSGLAALVWAFHGGTPADVRAIIENSADSTGALGQNFNAWVQHGRINLYQALSGDAPPPPPPPADVISLSVSVYKVKGVQHADLSWNGATSSTVDIYRDGSPIATGTPNDGIHTDNIGNKGGGSYSYQVCEGGTATCSENVQVGF